MDTLAKYLVTFLYQSNHLNENEEDKQFLDIIMKEYGIEKNEMKFALDKTKVNRQQELEEITIVIDLLLTLTNVDFNE